MCYHSEPVTTRHIMASELTAELLSQPASHAARVMAIHRLDELSAAYDVFLGDEARGLHDVRVAVRRLRSWLRAYETEVGDTLRKKTKRRLRTLAHASNPARDAEVAVEWIAAQTAAAPRERPGLRFMTQRFEKERDDASADARHVLERKMPRVMSALSKELQTYWTKHDVTGTEPAATMAEATRDVLRDHGERLARAASKVESAGDARRAHRVRIAAKRLRYILETLTGNATAATLVKRLTTLQDLLGAAHDAHVIANRIVREIGEYAARDARHVAMRAMQLSDDDVVATVPPFSRTRAGLTALAVRAHEDDQRGVTTFHDSWRGRQIQSIVAAVTLLADGLGITDTPTSPALVESDRSDLASA